jgi:hypothetical protein
VADPDDVIVTEADMNDPELLGEVGEQQCGRGPSLHKLPGPVAT